MHWEDVKPMGGGEHMHIHVLYTCYLKGTATTV